MNIHQHAPPGSSGGHAALARLLEADWSRGVPDGYLAALDRLRKLRGEFEEQIAAAIDGLDLLDLAIEDLEPEHDAGVDDDHGMDEDTDIEAVNEDGGDIQDEPHDQDTDEEPSLGATETINQDGAWKATDTFWGSGEAEPSLGSIGSGCPSTMSQTAWAGGARDDREEENEHGGNVDDVGEPSIGAPELVLAADQPSVGAIVGNQEAAWSIQSAPGFVTDGEADYEDHDGDCDRESDEGFLPGSGCLDGTRPPSFMDASKPNFGRPFADPTKMPARYAMVVQGHCMSPAIRDGEALVFVRDEQFLMRDLVVIYLDPAKAVTAGGHQALVKRFMGYGRCAAGDGIVVEFDHPTPTRYVIPNDRILAVHRCVGKLPENAKRHIVSEAEVALV